MKKIIFLLISLAAFQNLSYAAFPIVENCNSITVANELPVESGDNAAKLSMIFAGIAIFFNLLVFLSSGWGALLPLFFAGVFYLLAFIFGLFGLRSKSKRWQAFIGLFSTLLVLLVLAISAGSTGDPNAKD